MTHLQAPTVSDWPSFVILAVAGACASGVNAFAGGGSLISFPSLILLGVPPPIANATNAVALVPGSLASALGFRDHLKNVKAQILLLLLPTAIGSIAGSLLLVSTPPKLFDYAVPVLIFIATLLLILQPRIKSVANFQQTTTNQWIVCLAQFAISIYGGYFGAGMGIMMLGAFGILLNGTIHDMNTIKNWLAVAINLVAAVLFLMHGMIWLFPALAIMLGAIVGGYSVARLSLKVDPELMRRIVICLGLALTAWFAFRTYGGGV